MTPSNPGPTIRTRDRWIGLLALVGSVAYLLACLPTPVTFSPSERYYAYVASSPRPTSPDPPTADASKKSDPEAPPDSRLIVVDRELRVVSTIDRGPTFLPSVVFLDEDTLIGGQFRTDDGLLEYSTIDRSSGSRDVFLRLDLGGVAKDERQGFSEVASFFRVAAAHGRVVVNVPGADQIGLIEVDLKNKRGWLLPVRGFLPVVSPDGAHVAFLESDEWEPLGFSERRPLELGRTIPVEELLPTVKEPESRPDGEPGEDATNPKKPEAKKKKNWTLEVYTFETGSRVHAPIGEWNLDHSWVSSIFDLKNRRVLIADKGRLRALGLEDGATETIMATPEAGLAAATRDGSTILAFVAEKKGPPRLERWEVATRTRETVLPAAATPFDWISWGLSPEGAAFVMVQGERFGHDYGVLSIEVDLATQETRVAVPTALDGLVLLEHWSDGEAPRSAWDRALYEQVVRTTRTLIAACRDDVRLGFEARLRKVEAREAR